MLESIIKDVGIKATRIEQVSGGDINEAYCIYEDGRKLFLKTNSASAYPNMFAKEARALQVLSNNCSLQTPKVIKHGVFADQQYLFLEWIERGIPVKDYWEEFGNSLAEMHKKPQAYFGFEEDNYIGSLHQSNKKHNTWSAFYSEERILPLTDQLNLERKLVEKFCTKLDHLFPKESPSLLHGDLWSGNFFCAENGKACIYDPAVYCGNREMDIGMTKLFGGFEKRFYEAYHSTYPLENEWEERVAITQLYPLLVHAVLFGGGYIESAKQIIRKYS